MVSRALVLMLAPGIKEVPIAGCSIGTVSRNTILLQPYQATYARQESLQQSRQNAKEALNLRPYIPDRYGPLASLRRFWVPHDLVISGGRAKDFGGVFRIPEGRF